MLNKLQSNIPWRKRQTKISNAYLARYFLYSVNVLNNIKTTVEKLSRLNNQIMIGPPLLPSAVDLLANSSVLPCLLEDEKQQVNRKSYLYLADGKNEVVRKTDMLSFSHRGQKKQHSKSGNPATLLINTILSFGKIKYNIVVNIQKLYSFRQSHSTVDGMVGYII